MAEQVQSILDGMVPALADWKARGLFDDSEIRMIVQRRRESEYKIHKRDPQLKDFLRYLDTETKLHELFTLRYRKWKREQKKDSKQQSQKQPPIIGEYHCLQFLHNLWERTLRKFRQVDLFLEYAAFCQMTKSWKKLSHVYTRAIRFFPHHVPLYIEAASFEYFQRHNLTAARVWLQRGLRLHPAAADLWWQSFTLEMHFVQKMMGRRHILLSSSSSEQQPQEEDTNQSNELVEDCYAIARLVLDHAMASPADSLSFRLRFLEICQSFPHPETWMTHIQSTIQKDYNTVEAWMARIKYTQQRQQQEQPQQHTSKDDDSSSEEEEEDDDDDEEVQSESDQSSMAEKDRSEKQLPIKNSTAVETVVHVIRQACQALRTTEMWKQALEFLNETIRDDNTNDEAAWKLLRDLLEDDIVTHSPQLLLWYAKFKIQVDQDRKAAIQILRNYVETQDPVPAEIWIQLASLLYADDEPNAAFQVFETALRKIPIHQADHMHVLLQYFSACLQTRKDRVTELFQKITLLAPGFRNLPSIPDAPFELVTSIPKACWHYLLFSLEQGTETFRKSYQIVLYQSNLADQLVQMDAETMIDFVDKTIEEELRGEIMNNTHKKRLQRLFETAIHLFRGTPVASEYRKQRDDFMYNSVRLSVKESVAFENGVPTFDVAEPSCTSSDVENAFHNFQAVLLKNVNRSSGRQRQLKWNDLRSVFQKLNEEDKKSWCVETHGGSISLEPAEFLDSQRDKRDRAYCSFLIQQDVQEYESTLERLPCQKLLGFDWVYEPALWIFFGRNPVGSMCLDGRPDHTDSVTHDGTWHYQLSGTKRWILRPTSEILSRVKSQGFVVPREQVVLEIECKEGDVFILNTRVWFHRTMIPPQSCPSVSYARDFRIPDGSDKSLSGNMTNVDGLYATTDIENNTIIFTEIDMPNVELHRSAVAPNCGVVELEDGTHAVVSLRRIPAGEFFTVMESDESSSSDDEESDDLVD